MPFYCCYLLRSVASPTSQATYIGFSTNPGRRLRQHNGEIKAGAYKTQKKRPWKQIVIVSGFPNKLLALQFEWQWQHPEKSRHFNINNEENQSEEHEQPKKRPRKQGGYKTKLQTLYQMINLPLWKQLQLTIFIIDESLISYIQQLFQSTLVNISLKTLSSSDVTTLHISKNLPHCVLSVETMSLSMFSTISCSFCHSFLRKETSNSSSCSSSSSISPSNELLAWKCNECNSLQHLTCTAREYFQSSTQQSHQKHALIPLFGECGTCCAYFPWLDIIRHKILREELETCDGNESDLEEEQELEEERGEDEDEKEDENNENEENKLILQTSEHKLIHNQSLEQPLSQLSIETTKEHPKKVRITKEKKKNAVRSRADLFFASNSSSPSSIPLTSSLSTSLPFPLTSIPLTNPKNVNYSLPPKQSFQSQQMIAFEDSEEDNEEKDREELEENHKEMQKEKQNKPIKLPEPCSSMYLTCPIIIIDDEI